MYCTTYPRVTNNMGTTMGMKAFIAAFWAALASSPAPCWAACSSA